MKDDSQALLAEFVSRFDTKTLALAELNSILGTRYDLNRLGQWRRGEQGIPGIVTGFLVGAAEVLRT